VIGTPRGSDLAASNEFFCRAANRALSVETAVALNADMSLRDEIDSGELRRRAQRGARDIMCAVMLTVAAVVLIGVAWLGNHRGGDMRMGPSAEVSKR